MAADIKTLRQFEAVVRLGGVTAAARELGLKQPAVSMALARLARETGLVLFERRGQTVAPTDAARLLAESARNVIAAADAFEAHAAALGPAPEAGAGAGKITIAFCDRGPQWFVVPRFRLLVADAAGIQVDCRMMAPDTGPGRLLAARTRSGRADIVVADAPVQMPGVAAEYLVGDVHYLSVPRGHPLAGRASVRLADLGPVEILFLGLDGAFSRRLRAFVADKLPHIRLVVETDYFVFQERLRRTQALTFTTALVRHYRFDGMGREEIPILDDLSAIGYWIHYRRQAPAAVRRFVDFAHALVASSGLQGRAPAQAVAPAPNV